MLSPTTSLHVGIMAVALSLAACGAETTADKTSPDATIKPATDGVPTSLPRTPAPEGARVFFITPADGDTVSNPVVIEFGVDGVAVVKAGINEPASGHHHLIIDAGMPDPALPIPASDNYIHFGDASMKTERTLTPGKHTLQLLLGDHLHIPHDPPIASDVITITVE